MAPETSPSEIKLIFTLSDLRDLTISSCLEDHDADTRHLAGLVFEQLFGMFAC